MAETQEKYREALAELVPWGKNGVFQAATTSHPVRDAA